MMLFAAFASWFAGNDRARDEDEELAEADRVVPVPVAAR